MYWFYPQPLPPHSPVNLFCCHHELCSDVSSPNCVTHQRLATTDPGNHLESNMEPWKPPLWKGKPSSKPACLVSLLGLDSRVYSSIPFEPLIHFNKFLNQHFICCSVSYRLLISSNKKLNRGFRGVVRKISVNLIELFRHLVVFFSHPTKTGRFEVTPTLDEFFNHQSIIVIAHQIPPEVWCFR